MGTILTIVLGIATILGGIAAIWYFIDKWCKKRNWVETDKQVNDTWWQSSELKKDYEGRGFTKFCWSDRDRVDERILKGKQIVFEIDEEKRIKNRLVNKSGQVLLCKKSV